MTLEFREAASIRGLTLASETESRRLATVLPRAQVLHTGGSSIGRLLTVGDIDIHVRVAASDFDAAAQLLAYFYARYRPQMWTGSFTAYTGDRDGHAVGVALTSIGSEHDRRFTLASERLASGERLIDEYNALKRRHAGGDVRAYETDKSAFFSRITSDGPAQVRFADGEAP